MVIALLKRASPSSALLVASNDPLSSSGLQEKASNCGLESRMNVGNDPSIRKRFFPARFGLEEADVAVLAHEDKTGDIPAGPGSFSSEIPNASVGSSKAQPSERQDTSGRASGFIAELDPKSKFAVNSAFEPQKFVYGSPAQTFSASFPAGALNAVESREGLPLNERRRHESFDPQVLAALRLQFPPKNFGGAASVPPRRLLEDPAKFSESAMLPVFDADALLANFEDVGGSRKLDTRESADYKSAEDPSEQFDENPSWSCAVEGSKSRVPGRELAELPRDFREFTWDSRSSLEPRTNQSASHGAGVPPPRIPTSEFLSSGHEGVSALQWTDSDADIVIEDTLPHQHLRPHSEKGALVDLTWRQAEQGEPDAIEHRRSSNSGSKVGTSSNIPTVQSGGASGNVVRRAPACPGPGFEPGRPGSAARALESRLASCLRDMAPTTAVHRTGGHAPQRALDGNAATYESQVWDSFSAQTGSGTLLQGAGDSYFPDERLHLRAGTPRLTSGSVDLGKSAAGSALQVENLSSMAARLESKLAAIQPTDAGEQELSNAALRLATCSRDYMHAPLSGKSESAGLARLDPVADESGSDNVKLDLGNPLPWLLQRSRRHRGIPATAKGRVGNSFISLSDELWKRGVTLGLEKFLDLDRGGPWALPPPRPLALPPLSAEPDVSGDSPTQSGSTLLAGTALSSPELLGRSHAAFEFPGRQNSVNSKRQKRASSPERHQEGPVASVGRQSSSSSGGSQSSMSREGTALSDRLLATLRTLRDSAAVSGHPPVTPGSGGTVDLGPEETLASAEVMAGQSTQSRSAGGAVFPVAAVVKQAYYGGRAPDVQSGQRIAVLRKRLLRLVEVLEEGKTAPFLDLFKQLKPSSKAKGNAQERALHYCLRALMLRFTGGGYASFREPLRLNFMELKEARVWYYTAFPTCPFVAVTIAGAVIPRLLGHQHVHVIDLGQTMIPQWPAVIRLLACQPRCISGAPLHFRFTYVDTTYLVAPGRNALKAVRAGPEVGKMLQRVADAAGVSFSFELVDLEEDTWHLLHSIKRHPEAAVAICCPLEMMFYFSDGAESQHPRFQLFQWMKSLKPAVVPAVEIDLQANKEPLMARVRNSFDFHLALFRAHDETFQEGDRRKMLVFEECWHGRMICSMLGCEGLQRIVRPMDLKTIQEHFQAHGFSPLPVSQKVVDAVQEVLESYPPEFSLVLNSNGGTLQLCFQGVPLVYSAMWVVDGL